MFHDLVELTYAVILFSLFSTCYHFLLPVFLSIPCYEWKNSLRWTKFAGKEVSTLGFYAFKSFKRIPSNVNIFSTKFERFFSFFFFLFWNSESFNFLNVFIFFLSFSFFFFFFFSLSFFSLFCLQFWTVSDIFFNGYFFSRITRSMDKYNLDLQCNYI